MRIEINQSPRRRSGLARDLTSPLRQRGIALITALTYLLIAPLLGVQR